MSLENELAPYVEKIVNVVEGLSAREAKIALTFTKHILDAHPVRKPELVNALQGLRGVSLSVVCQCQPPLQEWLSTVFLRLSSCVPFSLRTSRLTFGELRAVTSGLWFGLLFLSRVAT